MVIHLIDYLILVLRPELVHEYDNQQENVQTEDDASPQDLAAPDNGHLLDVLLLLL